MTFTIKKDMTCPHCGKINDRHSDVGTADSLDVEDQFNSVSLCSSCHGLAFFEQETMSLRMPTQEERVQLDSDPDIQEILAKLKRPPKLYVFYAVKNK